VGDEARGLARGAQNRGLPASRHTHLGSPEDAGIWLKEHVLEGDVVLLKASRGVHLEKVWEQLESTRTEHTREAAQMRNGVSLQSNNA